MEFPLHHPRLDMHNLTIRTSAWLGPKLLQNGTPLQRVKGKYLLKDNTGKDVTVQLKIDFLDMAVPKVLIDNQAVEIAPPLSVAQKIWVLSPLLLMLFGGALGGAIGGGAAFINARILRSYDAPAARYGLSALVLVGAIFMYLIFVTILALLLGGADPEINA